MTRGTPGRSERAADTELHEEKATSTCLLGSLSSKRPSSHVALLACGPFALLSPRCLRPKSRTPRRPPLALSEAQVADLSEGQGARVSGWVSGLDGSIHQAGLEGFTTGGARPASRSEALRNSAQHPPGCIKFLSTQGATATPPPHPLLSKYPTVSKVIGDRTSPLALSTPSPLVHRRPTAAHPG